MTKSKTTKRALLSSCVALMLCFSMLLGTTYAWFTDSVTSAGNIIASGTLDVAMTWSKDLNADKENWTDASTGAIFNYDKWEPGYTEIRYVEIANKGTLGLKYILNIVPNAEGDALKLAEVIDVYLVKDIATAMNRDNLGEKVGTLKDLMTAAGGAAYGVILPNGVDKDTTTMEMSSEDKAIAVSGASTYGIALKMQESAGNEYQNLSIGGDYGFAVQLLATQLQAEMDSFGSDYDKDAEYPDVWSGTSDTSWYNDTDMEFVITTAEQLAGLAEMVNAGNTFKGKTVKLGANLDLDHLEWTPIGTGAGFKGTFDGAGYTISNLKITGNNNTVGLFANTYDGAIKNLTIKNADVSGRLNVGVVAGNPYTSKYSNITVTGHVEVNGMAYVGGVGGKNAYTDWTDITMNVDGTSYVNANSVENDTAYRTYVGGVIGFMGEGGHKFTNVTSNIDVIGSTCDVGGITGIAHYGNSFINCSSSGDVSITNAAEVADAEEMGGIAGVWHNQTGYTVTFKNCDFTGTLTANITDGVDLSDNTITGKKYSESGEGELVILPVKVDNADTLAAKLANGGEVVMTADIDMDAATTAPYGNKYGLKMDGGVLDGNGNKLDIECYGDDYGIMTAGGTVKNLTIEEGCRAIMIMYPTEDIILDNVNIGGDGVLYPINTGEAGSDGVDLIVTNSTLKGWTSYSNIESASFTNVKFEQGTYYNNIYGRVLKPYVNTTLTDCSFIEHMNLDLSGLAQGQKVTIENCTVNGQAVTVDVFTVPSTDAEYDTELFTVDLPSWASSVNDCVTFN